MEISTGIAVPITIGLVEVAKRLGIPTRFAALLSVIVGLVLAFLTVETSQIIITGLVVGLSASGLFSLGKPVAVKALSMVKK